MNDFYISSSPSGKSAFKPFTQSSKSASVEFSSSRSTPFLSSSTSKSSGNNPRKVEPKVYLFPIRSVINSRRLTKSKSLNDLNSKKKATRTPQRCMSVRNFKEATSKAKNNENKSDLMKNHFDFQLTKIDLQFKISSYVKNIETKNFNSKISKYLVHKKDSIVSCSNTNTSINSLSLFRSHVKEADKFPCSNSLIDLLITILRFKEATETIIDLLIPSELVKENLKFFQAKFTCINNIYQVGYFSP